MIGMISCWKQRLPSQNHDGLWKLVSSLWSRNRMTQHGMVSHNTAKEGVGYNVLSLYGHGNYLRVLKDAYWSRFCSKGKPSMLFITFRSFVIHCVKEDGEEDDRPTVWQCKASHCSCVYWEDSEEWLGSSPHPPCSLDLAHLDYQLFKFVKYQMCNQWWSLGSHLSSFTNCCYRVLPHGNLHTSTAVAKTHWSAKYLAEKWINCTDLTDVVLSYSYPYVTLKLFVHDFRYRPCNFWHVRCH